MSCGLRRWRGVARSLAWPSWLCELAEYTEAGASAGLSKLRNSHSCLMPHASPALGTQHSALDPHHTWHSFAPRTIGALSLQSKAFWNCGRSETMPLMRYLPGEWGLVRALTRRFSLRWFSQAHWAKPMKKRWSGVKPSAGCRFWLAVASFQAM